MTSPHNRNIHIKKQEEEDNQFEQKTHIKLTFTGVYDKVDASDSDE